MVLIYINYSLTRVYGDLISIVKDENEKMNLSIKDIQGELLIISQFTLYCNTKKSNRPSFTDSMAADKAKELYLEFNRILNEEYLVTKQFSRSGYEKNHIPGRQASIRRNDSVGVEKRLAPYTLCNTSYGRNIGYR